MFEFNVDILFFNIIGHWLHACLKKVFALLVCRFFQFIFYWRPFQSGTEKAQTLIWEKCIYECFRIKMYDVPMGCSQLINLSFVAQNCFWACCSETEIPVPIETMLYMIPYQPLKSLFNHNVTEIILRVSYILLPESRSLRPSGPDNQRSEM